MIWNIQPRLVRIVPTAECLHPLSTMLSVQLALTIFISLEITSSFTKYLNHRSHGPLCSPVPRRSCTLFRIDPPFTSCSRRSRKGILRLHRLRLKYTAYPSARVSWPHTTRRAVTLYRSHRRPLCRFSYHLHRQVPNVYGDNEGVESVRSRVR